MNRLRAHFHRRFPTLNAQQAPIYLTSFLLLHELTAVLPLPIAYWCIHRWQLGDRVLAWPWVHSTVQQMDLQALRERILRRKRVPADAEDDATENDADRTDLGTAPPTANLPTANRPKTNSNNNNTKNNNAMLILEWTAAYAVVKALMPVRLGLSGALTPWFARRVVEPVWRRFKRVRSGNGVVNNSASNTSHKPGNGDTLK